MYNTSTQLQTTEGSRYIRMLCKHFAHKISAPYSEWRGDCEFVCGTATMLADGQSLRFELSADSSEGLDQTKHVIEDHLIRFAHREGLVALDWQDSRTTAD